MFGFDPAVNHRRSIRVKEYDYSQAGSYFITACTKNRECVLGTVTDDGVGLSPLGEIVARQWVDLPNRFPNLALDAFVVMPNHVHGIIVLGESVGATLAVAQNSAEATLDVTPKEPGASSSVDSSRAGPSPSVAQGRAGASPAPTGARRPRLGDVVGAFKSLCVREWLHYIRQHRLDIVAKFWQRNYYEHIIRNDSDLDRVRKYIAMNPFHWESDYENPQACSRSNVWGVDEETWFSNCVDND